MSSVEKDVLRKEWKCKSPRAVPRSFLIKGN
jgi:hypothetical protein